MGHNNRTFATARLPADHLNGLACLPAGHRKPICRASRTLSCASCVASLHWSQLTALHIMPQPL